ncbi:MAG: hypothetical protein LBC71_02490, partial [Oscillospiraceae bacterium]|nr:hypothetical protein [Oscillospiraceae bacterium]
MINKNTIKQIYNALQDEMSKFIYINRLLYSLTGDFLLLRNKDNLNNEYMQKVLRKTSKFVLYGAGKIGESLFEDFPSM